MADWQWIAKQVVLSIHDRQIAEHGGSSGIRDTDLLESALNRPLNLAAYGQPAVHELAASYGYGLAKNHPFMDGNKRTAYVVTRLFLALHGVSLNAAPMDKVRTFEKLAAGDIDEAELAHWLQIQQPNALPRICQPVIKGD